MGLFDKIFKKPSETIKTDGFFEMLNGYAPTFTNAPESLYEMEIIRSAINSYSTLCSKLRPEIRGSKLAHLEKQLQFRFNPFQTTSQFIRRLATILEVNNTAFIIPLEDASGQIYGFYPILPLNCEVVERGGNPYLRYTFANGRRATIELDRVGVMVQQQYNDDFFGTTNDALKPTMQLIHTQNQGIIAGVKTSATIRFLARVANIIAPEDLKAERERFTKENLSEDNKSGVIIFDKKFDDIKQVDNKPFTINAVQMKQIADNVYGYFGTNEAIVQNKYDEEQWNAYFEGKIEPFALQLSLVLSNMVYSAREISHGNAIVFTTNRLQYASNATKLNISTSLFDRGLLTRNNVMDIWSLPHVKDGDLYYIRKEYAKLEDIGKEWQYDENGQPIDNNKPPSEPTDPGEPPNPPGEPPGADAIKEKE